MTRLTEFVLLAWPMMMGLGWLSFWRDGLSPQWRTFLWPVWIAGGGILMSLVLWQQDGDVLTRLLMIGGLGVYCASVIRRVRFCPHCGSLEMAPEFFGRPGVCAACGKPMDDAADAAPEKTGPAAPPR